MTVNPYGALKDFREGNFKPIYKEKALIFIKRLKKLEPFMDQGVVRDRFFLRALEIVYRSIEEDELIGKLEKSKISITYQSSLKGYIRLFEDILSWKNRVLKRISIKRLNKTQAVV